MKFTRRQVLEAIRFENLKTGNFCTGASNANGECEVCAVGGLLRRAGIPVARITRKAWSLVGGNLTAVSADGDEEAALKNKNYLQALSVKFEKLADKHGTGKRTRRKLSDFVKANFPKEFTTLRG